MNMKSSLIKITILSLLLAPFASLANPGPGPNPRPAPRPAPYPRHSPPPMGGQWFAVGGIAYLTGTVIRACAEPPVVIYTQPVRTVVVQPNPTVVVQPAQTIVVQQPNTVVVNSAPAVLSRESLRADIAGSLAGSLQNIPYSVSVDNFYSMGSSYGASITVVVSVNGSNYSITSGGLQPSYSALRTFLSNEITASVGKLAAQPSQTTTVVQIQ